MDMLSLLKGLDSTSIIFGGLTIVCVCLIVLLYKMGKLFFNHASEVIERNTNATIRQAKTNQQVSDALYDLSSVIKEKIK